MTRAGVNNVGQSPTGIIQTDFGVFPVPQRLNGAITALMDMVYPRTITPPDFHRFETGNYFYYEWHYDNHKSC